jgi:hypothetical protein
LGHFELNQKSNEISNMAEQARSTETIIQEMLLNIMNKLDKYEQEREHDRREFQEMRGQFRDTKAEREQDREQFNSRMDRSDEKFQDRMDKQNDKFEKCQNEIKSEIS